MARSRYFFASILSCALLLAGLIVGSVRPAQTQGTPASRQPFAETIQVALNPGEWASPAQGGSPLTVPAGRTMVVEYATSFVNLPAGQHAQICLRVASRGMKPNSGVGYVIFLHGTDEPIPSTAQHQIVASEPIGLHLQSGDFLKADLMRPQAEATSRAACSITIGGYLE